MPNLSAQPKAPAKTKVKADPAHVAKARELRDRYLEHLNGEHLNGEQFNAGKVLPGGKYQVSRALQCEGGGLRMEDGKDKAKPSSILHLPSACSPAELAA